LLSELDNKCPKRAKGRVYTGSPFCFSTRT
jgi:hypothetical protein